MSATLRLTRGIPFGIELRRGEWGVAVDGKTVGSINLRDTVEVPFDPGRHTLQPGCGQAPHAGGHGGPGGAPAGPGGKFSWIVR